LVDLALYEPLFRLIEWQLPLWELLGELAVRNGPRFPFDGAFVTDICATRDGESIVVSAATTDSLELLRGFVRGEGLLAEDGNDTDLVNGLREWVRRHDRAEAIARLSEAGLIIGSVYSASDLAEDPHVAARENIVSPAGEDGEGVPMPAALPRLSATPGSVKWPGPPLGHHTRQVLAEDLGLPAERIEELLSEGVVAGGDDA
jgi:crotonobetainyl-CoA:carnitine CoA-transferase CaiB-like acyl-CoA transferase